MLWEMVGVRIRICGSAVPADRSGEQQEPSLVLAERRAQRVQTLLVEEFEIAPERLFLCAPAVDKDDNAKPRVELSL